MQQEEPEKKEQIPLEKTLLRPDEVARILRVSRWTVYRWVAEGRLEGSKVGKGTLRVFKTSVERLLEG